VGDGSGLAWIGHGVDLVEALLVANADAFVLAQMFVPRANDVLLEDMPRVRRVPPHAPTDRACTASGVAPGGRPSGCMGELRGTAISELALAFRALRKPRVLTHGRMGTVWHPGRCLRNRRPQPPGPAPPC
jgi:hypothetical protein